MPWAWAVNGCASVLSAILATLLAINLGTTAVVLLAVLLYLLAALVFAGPGPAFRPGSSEAERGGFAERGRAGYRSAAHQHRDCPTRRP